MLPFVSIIGARPDIVHPDYGFDRFNGIEQRVIKLVEKNSYKNIRLATGKMNTIPFRFIGRR